MERFPFTNLYLIYSDESKIWIEVTKFIIIKYLMFNCKSTLSLRFLSQEEKELGERRAAELVCFTGLFFLRRTQEVINKYLPPKIENVVFCRPGALQLELYQKLLNSQAVRFCLQGSLENSPHLICIGALKKLCNHPCLLLNSVKVSSMWDCVRMWAEGSLSCESKRAEWTNSWGCICGFPQGSESLQDGSAL